ncbi:hypothetical protein BD626DRAFT_487571 [Schizophyllum amplum]|uniref:BTB domain-containing protein n=1 Tax=Schizophyllum amplum TaxID=97359 RepID=A0A550CNP4_9AGAR|nr:hypothetical protein BD626DRAFT_487571 [Auriculariopsis ampla]
MDAMQEGGNPGAAPPGSLRETQIPPVQAAPGPPDDARTSSQGPWSAPPITTTGIDASHTSPPGATQPQPFPLSPPTPTVELQPENPAGVDIDLSDDSEDLPDLERLNPPSPKTTVKEEDEDSIVYVSSRDPSPAPRARVVQPPPSSSKPPKPRMLSATQAQSSQSPRIKPKPASSRNAQRPGLKRRLSTSLADASSSPKRARAAVKHEDFWALDGSVILQVENVQFKLHRSSLAKQSAWMAVLFEESPDSEDIGGVPIYCLDRTGLRAGDLEILLRTWENAILYALEPAPFITTVAVLRASLALHFMDYESFARHQLRRLWPDGLEDLTTTRIPNAVATVVLTRDGHMPGVRKRAMYELVRTEGFSQGPNEEKLSEAEYSALVRAREKLTNVWIMNAGMAPKVGLPDGHSDLHCIERLGHGIRAHYSALSETKILEEYANDAICGLQALAEIDWKAHGFCDRCATAKRNAWNEIRQKQWENLDLWLGEQK